VVDYTTCWNDDLNVSCAEYVANISATNCSCAVNFTLNADFPVFIMSVTWLETVLNYVVAIVRWAINKFNNNNNNNNNNNKNNNTSLAHSYLFVPVVAEKMGAINKDGMDILSDLGRHITQHRQPPRECLPLPATLNVNLTLQCSRCLWYLCPITAEDGM